MKKLKLVLLMTITILGISACNINKTDEAQNGGTTKVTQTSDGYFNISPQEAKKRLDSEQGIVLLDVRTIEEYNEKHIPGSLLIPVANIDKEAPAKLTNKEAHIFVYCRSGNRSVAASKALIKMGYKNVYNLGGINNWPYETGTGATK